MSAFSALLGAAAVLLTLRVLSPDCGCAGRKARLKAWLARA